MRVAVIAKPNNGCCFYRCILPMDYISWEENGDDFKLFVSDNTLLKTKDTDLAKPLSELESFEPDIIFYNRDVSSKDIEWILKQKQKGVKIIVDIDDYWELNASHPIYNYWVKNNIGTRVVENLKIADVVITTTELLRKKVLEYNKNCIVIPNSVPFGEPFYTQNVYKKDLSERKMNFLYAGGSTHYPDISLLKNSFDKLGQDKFVIDKANFILAGFDPLPNKHCEWDKMASVFKRTNSSIILPTRPIQQHMLHYEGADVCLIPLVKNEFNKYKSELKIIEAATRELPCIVSNVQPYSELGNLPGLFWDDWQKNIKFCLKNPKEVVSLGKQLAEVIKEKYDVRTWGLVRYQLFKHLLK